MIDIHSHIIPGLDDGASNLSEFIEMANLAVDAGITDIIATPHHMNGFYFNPKEKILEVVKHCQKFISSEKIPLKIHPGQEVKLQKDMLKYLNSEVLTVQDKGKFLLLELPSREIPPFTHDIMYELRLKEITPIIVHPERNKALVEEPNLLFSFIQNGALVQLTAGSVLGHFGKKINAFSEKLIAHHWVHFIASDAHNSSTKSFHLRDAYEYISSYFGQDFTAYYKRNAEMLLHGQNIMKEEPIPLRRKILGLF